MGGFSSLPHERQKRERRRAKEKKEQRKRNDVIKFLPRVRERGIEIGREGGREREGGGGETENLMAKGNAAGGGKKISFFCPARERGREGEREGEREEGREGGQERGREGRRERGSRREREGREGGRERDLIISKNYIYFDDLKIVG